MVSTSDRSSASHRSLSYADRLASTWQEFLLLVGRVMLGWIFLQSGYNKLFDIAGVAATYPRRGLAPWLAYLAVPVEFLGGLFLIVGLATRYTALVLVVFVIVASFSSHAYWTVPDAQRANQSSHFWKNITIIGGLVMLFVTSAGRLSLDRLLSRRQG